MSPGARRIVFGVVIAVVAGGAILAVALAPEDIGYRTRTLATGEPPETPPMATTPRGVPPGEAPPTGIGPVGPARPDRRPAAPGEPAPAGPDLENGRLVAVGGSAGGPRAACFTCHGLNGAGDTSGAFPRLSGLDAWYMYKQLRDYAAGSRPNEIMSPIARALTQAEMEDVSAYYAGFRDAPYPPQPDADPLTIQRGAAISAIGASERGVQACVNCHGPAGMGMGPGFPQLAGQYARYAALQLTLWQQGVRRNDPLEVMANVARRLTGDDIRAVSLYFQAVRPFGAAGAAESAAAAAP